MELLLALPVLLVSVVAHEYAHGWVALREGDDTAYEQGRLTLNPMAHIDLVGSVIVPVVLWASNAGFLFGWAKPVPVNPGKYRDYRKGDIRVSLAGVAVNLALAAAFTLLIVALVYVARLVPMLDSSAELLRSMARYGVLINLVLAFFNLIPVPPLDGSHVVYHLLPPRAGARYRALGRYGILILMGILFLAPGLLDALLWPVWQLDGLASAFVGLWT